MSQDIYRDPGHQSEMPLGGAGREFEQGAGSSYGRGDDRSSWWFGRIKGGAGSLGSEAMERASDYAEQGKSQVSDQLEVIAGAIRRAGEKLEEKQKDVPARYTREAAGRMERLARTLDETPIEEIVSAAQDFAYRHRRAFFGGAILAGAVLGRLAIASSRASSQGRDLDHDDWNRRDWDRGDYGQSASSAYGTTTGTTGGASPEQSGGEVGSL